MLRRTNEYPIRGLRLATAMAAIVALFWMFATDARAQYPTGWSPRVELSGTYSFLRANAAHAGQSFNVNGESESLAYDFSDRFSAVVDLGNYRFSGLTPGVKSTMYTYLFGPRMVFAGFRRVIPFAQILLGGGRLNASTSGIAAGENGLVVAIGGGLDVPFHRYFAFRAIQVEYFMTQFNNLAGLAAKQNNVRISTGLVIQFGGR